MSAPYCTPFRLVAHLVVMAAGGLLAARMGDPGENTKTVVPNAARSPAAVAPPRTAVGGATARAAVCRESWEMLKSESMPYEQKREMQKRLLAQWLEVDFDAALAAAMEVKESYFYGNDLLLDVFRDRLRDDPGPFLAAMHDLRFGEKTDALVEWWAKSTVQENPSAGEGARQVVSHLDELGPVSRVNVVVLTAHDMADNKAGKEALLAALAELPDTPENRVLWREAGAAPMMATCSPGGMQADPEPDVAGRLQAADTLAKRFMLVDDIARDLRVPSAEGLSFMRRFSALPDDIKPEVANYFLLNSADVGPLTDELIARGEWEILASRRPPDWYTPPIPEADAETKLAHRDWAVTLPDRDEVAAVFDDAVRDYIGEEPAAAQAWVGALSSPWKRDRALVLLIASSLENGPDSTVAEWAVPRITDAGMRTKAAQQVAAWKDQHGVEPGDEPADPVVPTSTSDDPFAPASK